MWNRIWLQYSVAEVLGGPTLKQNLPEGCACTGITDNAQLLVVPCDAHVLSQQFCSQLAPSCAGGLYAKLFVQRQPTICDATFGNNNHDQPPNLFLRYCQR